VIYLAIMFVVAAVGMGVLWMQQRRERSHLETVERFQASMEKISPGAAGPAPVRTRRTVRPDRAGAAKQLDPDRREAARRRLEARRRAALAKANAAREPG
jgi:hypothetical protein